VRGEGPGGKGPQVAHALRECINAARDRASVAHSQIFSLFFFFFIRVPSIRFDTEQHSIAPLYFSKA
jgi:hypothetical protein